MRSPRGAPAPLPLYSLNAAIAVSPLFTVTLFDLLAPLEGRQSTV